MANLTVIGATRQVTGSCYLLETGTSTIQLECGMYQGNPEVERPKRQGYPFDIEQRDAVAHFNRNLTHVGLLPRLVR